LHCPLEKCHYPGDFTPEEVKIVRDTCPVSCGTCTSYHEVPHAPLFSCNVWNGGSVHVEECRPGLVSATYPLLPPSLSRLFAIASLYISRFASNILTLPPPPLLAGCLCFCRYAD
jgi:hypothetical protein